MSNSFGRACTHFVRVKAAVTTALLFQVNSVLKSFLSAFTQPIHKMLQKSYEVDPISAALSVLPWEETAGRMSGLSCLWRKLKI